MYLQGRRALRQSPVALAFHMRYHVWNSLFYRAPHPRSKARLVVKTPVRRESRMKARVPLPIAVLALFAFFLMNPSPAGAQTPGLVAAYAFNEGSGTTVADASGNNNNGTITAATWTTAGKFGNALAFNGTSARVTVPNAASLQLSTGMTLEAWVFPTGSLTSWRSVVDKTVDGYYLMASTDQNNRPGVGGTWTGGNQNVAAPTVLTINTWTHLAATFDGATVRLFVNGVQVASQAQTTPLATTPGTLQMGANSYGEFFAGRIDEVRIYNRALSATEIQTDMNTSIAPSAPDTTAPSAPTTLTATAASASQIDLAWSASTDNIGVTGYRVERCQGAGCTTFAQIAAPTTTSFNNTGLTAGTSYSYQVRAADAAGNLSAYSAVASATTSNTPSGLVAAYAFNEGSGTTVADASGNNNNGTITAATWTTAGKFGNALAFNGTSARVTVPNAASLQLSTGMTLEAWVFPTGSLTSWRSVVDKTVDGYYLMASTDQNNRPGVGGTWTGGNQNVAAPTVLTINTWTHLAATFDGATVRLFVNGVQVASQAQTTPLATTPGTLQMGANSYGEFFAGRIDEVRIYNRALSATEIQTDMNTSIAPSAPDTTAPSAPTTLTATAASASQIDLAWSASTDNVGVTGYRVERCQGAGCTTFAQVSAPTATSFNNTGLAAGTSYSYQVRAADAAGNLSAYSSVASATTSGADNAGVFTHRNDNFRTGQNPNETVLAPANVTPATFGKLFACAVDGEVYAQPLYVANFAIAGGTHNVVFVATQNDSVFAFDADASPCVQYWQKSFLGTGVTTVPPGDTGETGDINTIIGITGTPVIDPATSTLYVVAKTKEPTGYFQRLHALDLATGSEKFDGPADISSAITVPGSGDTGEATCPGSAGNLPFCPLRENQRPGLLLLH